MMEYLMPICAFIAGALIYIALHKDVEEGLSINISRNLLFPVFIIVLIIGGVYIAESIHLSEVANRNSNTQQKVSVMGCLIETSAECSTAANTLNSASQAKFQANEIPYMQLYLPFSVRDTIPRNILTWFCGGMFLMWVIFFGAGKNERTD